MILKLRDTAKIRSFLDTRTCDMIRNRNSLDSTTFGAGLYRSNGAIYPFDYSLYHVLTREKLEGTRSDTLDDRGCSKPETKSVLSYPSTKEQVKSPSPQVVRVLKGYTEEEVDNLFEKRGEECLDVYNLGLCQGAHSRTRFQGSNDMKARLSSADDNLDYGKYLKCHKA